MSPGLGLSGEMVSCEVELLPEQTMSRLASRTRVKDKENDFFILFPFISFKKALSQISEHLTNKQKSSATYN